MQAEIHLPSKTTFILSILIALIWSCNVKSESTHLNRSGGSSPDSVSAGIDTSFWLRPTKGIRAIFEDSNGNLWFGSTDYVCVFDPSAKLRTGGTKFTYFDEVDDRCGRGSNRIQEDQNGIIWVQSGPTICSYDPAAPSKIEGLRTNGTPFSTHTVNPSQSANVWASSANDLWFKDEVERFGKTEEPPGVLRYHDGEFTFLAFPVPQSESANQLYNWMTNVVYGRDGTTWFGTMEAAIGFHPSAEPASPDRQVNFTIIGREEMGRQDDQRNIGIRAIFEDSKGNLWLGDNGSGVFVYDGDTTINFTRMHRLDRGDTDGNSLHRMFSINEDSDGNMWFGTVYSGIWRYNPDSGDLKNFTEKDGVKSDLIWTINKTKKGELLFGGEDPGAVYKFNPSYDKTEGIAFERVY